MKLRALRTGSMFQRWRMRRLLLRHPIDSTLWQNETHKIPLLNTLDAVQMVHLRELTTWFLAHKSITGVQGLSVTPAMQIAVAAQACLLILHLDVDYFDGWVEIVLYPGAFRVQHAQTDAAGLVHHEASVLSGESWLRGPVILSWDDVARDTYQPHPGHNVVLHEFAHKLDGHNGAANGMPPLRDDMHREHWADALNRAYEALRAALAAGESTAIDPYAATNPAEFFAVVSEYFFTAPAQLKNASPEVYQQLALFYLAR
jgi:hypothetical protein